MDELSIESLRAMLWSDDERDRLEAAYLIGVRGDRRATLTLVERLRESEGEDEWHLRDLGARALGRLRDGRALPLLLDLARARHPGALEALGRLGRLAKKDGVPVLIASLAKPNLRSIVGRALARLGNPGVERGRVTAFDATRGFGFVRPAEGRPLFFHGRDWDANEPPTPGTAVTLYALRDIPKPCAVRLRTFGCARSVVVDPSKGVESTGIVQWFDASKGYGFVTDDRTGEGALARVRDIEDTREPRVLRARERVRFLAVPTEAGLRALRIRAAQAPIASPADGAETPRGSRP
ncbi:MAG: cold shock domain-containing protein [Deltaproteobacteria bacterium]|nr:cold shock domain-containing protein [Deltaproteobacteria bacterium]